MPVKQLRQKKEQEIQIVAVTVTVTVKNLNHRIPIVYNVIDENKRVLKQMIALVCLFLITNIENTMQIKLTIIVYISKL